MSDPYDHSFLENLKRWQKPETGRKESSFICIDDQCGAKGQPYFDLVKQRNARKYNVKPVKVAKDHSWRDSLASLTIKVSPIVFQSFTFNTNIFSLWEQEPPHLSLYHWARSCLMWGNMWRSPASWLLCRPTSPDSTPRRWPSICSYPLRPCSRTRLLNTV